MMIITQSNVQRITDNFNMFSYTYLHRIAFKKVLDKIENIIITGKSKFSESDKQIILTAIHSKDFDDHDMDKLLLYLTHDKKETHKIHRATSKHHLENSIPKSLTDIIHIIADWECAGLTKPDKPLNAFDTLYTFYPNYIDLMLPILQALNMDSSYIVENMLSEDDKIITVDNIVNCINSYVA